ncbi:hypothetical protein AB4Z21_33050, partial [Paenibacillus sp. MCAF20]
HTMSYRSVDNEGNREVAKTLSFKLDASAPELTVSGPEERAYAGTETMTLSWDAVDALSGVDSGSAAALLDGQPVVYGAVIPLYTLALGSHNFTVSVSDEAGNTGERTVIFSTYTDVNTLKALVGQFREMSWIDNHGIANSLIQKLDQGQLETFIHHVEAQSGKHIEAEAAAYLLRDANYILAGMESEE